MFILRIFERMLPELAQRLRMGARQGARSTSRSRWWSPSRRSSARSSSTSSSPRASSRPRIPASSRRPPRRSRTFRSRPWSSASARSPRSSEPTRRSHYVNSTVGVGGPNPTANQGRMLDRAQAEGGARRTATAVIQRLRRDDQRRHRHGDLLPDRCRTSMSAAGSPRASTSTRCNRATPRRSTSIAPELRDKIAKLAGLRDVNSDLYITNPQMTIEIDREKAAVYGVTDRPDPPGAVQRLRHPPGGDDLHADQRLSGHPGGRAGIPDRSVGLSKIFVKTNGTGRHGGRPAPGSGVTGNGIPSGSRSRSRR